MSDQHTEHKLCKAFEKFLDRCHKAEITTDAELWQWFEVPNVEALEDVVNAMLARLARCNTNSLDPVGSLVAGAILFGAYAAKEKLL